MKYSVVLLFALAVAGSLSTTNAEFEISFSVDDSENQRFRPNFPFDKVTVALNTMNI